MKGLRFVSCWLPAFLVFFGLAALAASGSSQHDVLSLHSATPAGYDVIQLKPSGAIVYLLGLIECPEIEGAQHQDEGLDARVVAVDGTTLRRFPRHFSFRVTASLRKTVLDPPADSVETAQQPEQFLLNLKFRLKSYNGLDVRELDPESVTLIGVPADVSYDERIYRVSFDIGDRPVSDRFVLEVLSPEGHRMSRFHFELL